MSILITTKLIVLASLFDCLLELMLYVPVNIFSVMSGCFSVLNHYLAVRVKCFVPGHDTMPPRMLKSLTYWSELEYCITELLGLCCKRIETGILCIHI